MLPHERSLVEKMKDRPFVLVGVNSDSAEKFKAQSVSEKVTWPCFFDGGDTSGPIATAWNVRGWPTIYVLDAKGVIRFKNVRGDAMEKAVEELLAESEKAPAQPAK